MCSSLKSPNLPLSCYNFVNDTTKLGDFHKNPDNQYNAQSLVDFHNQRLDGCSGALASWIEKYAPVLIGIGIGFAMLEMFGIIFAVCLCQNVGEDY